MLIVGKDLIGKKDFEGLDRQLSKMLDNGHQGFAIHASY